MSTETPELFELELLGGAFERRYRKARPDIEAMPWETLDASAYPEEELAAARRNWTLGAFQEFRTAAACASTLRALIEARAPIDLIAAFTRFPLDELAHVELCSRMAMALGGAQPVWMDSSAICADINPALSPLHRACELIARNFCVGEALSIPLLHATWLRATHPLARAVLGRIVRDEAAHGIFGWTFLDWALPLLDDDGKELIRATADAAIVEVERMWASLPPDDSNGQPAPRQANTLGWMRTGDYLIAAQKAMRARVLRPFQARDLRLDAHARFM